MPVEVKTLDVTSIHTLNKKMVDLPLWEKKKGKKGNNALILKGLALMAASFTLKGDALPRLSWLSYEQIWSG